MYSKNIFHEYYIILSHVESELKKNVIVFVLSFLRYN